MDLAPALLRTYRMEQQNVAVWRAELPRLVGRTVELREPATADLRPLVDLFFLTGGPLFGLTASVTDRGPALKEDWRDRSASSMTRVP